MTIYFCLPQTGNELGSILILNPETILNSGADPELYYKGAIFAGPSIVAVGPDFNRPYDLFAREDDGTIMYLCSIFFSSSGSHGRLDVYARAAENVQPFVSLCFFFFSVIGRVISCLCI